LAACVGDERQSAKVRHETIELLRQRVFGLAAGYADCNDAARLADDVIHKLVVSRFENAVGRRALIAMGHVLADTVIDHHRRRLKGRATRITIDLDPTDDPTHGQQEFTFFNGHYDTWCYLPVVATVTFNDEAEQFAVAAVLRPGNPGLHHPATHAKAALYPGAQGDPRRAGKLLPRVHRVFGNLKTWLLGTHHGVGSAHLQVYLDEFTFRFNRRRTPMAAFQTLLGLATLHGPTTYNRLYASE
jgi:hypothetical protein